MKYNEPFLADEIVLVTLYKRNKEVQKTIARAFLTQISLLIEEVDSFV